MVRKRCGRKTKTIKQIKTIPNIKLEQVVNQQVRVRHTATVQQQHQPGPSSSQSQIENKIQNSSTNNTTKSSRIRTTRINSENTTTTIQKPTREEINILTDENIQELMKKNWICWLKDKRTVGEGDIPEDQIPPLFRFKQPIKLFQILLNSTKEKEDDDEIKKDDVIDGVTNVGFNRGLIGSSCGFQCLDYSIPTINYLVHGARFWIIIKYSGNEKLEKTVAELSRTTSRSGCLNEKVILLSPETLIKNNIDFEIEIQREDETIIIFPGVYYGWVNLVDDTAVIRSHFVTEEWYEFARNREHERCTCRQTFILDWEKIENYRLMELGEKMNNLNLYSNIEIYEYNSEQNELLVDEEQQQHVCCHHSENSDSDSDSNSNSYE